MCSWDTYLDICHALISNLPISNVDKKLLKNLAILTKGHNFVSIHWSIFPKVDDWKAKLLIQLFQGT